MQNNLAQSAGQRATAFLLLWLSGACLRLTVLAIPPVVPLLHADLHLSETDIGWLSSLPPMLFAIAAVPGAMLIARFGIVPALVVGLLLNAIGSAARAAFPDALSLYVIDASRWRRASRSCSRRCRRWCAPGFRSASASPPRFTPTVFWSARFFPSALTIPLVLPLFGDSWRMSFVFWSLPVLLTALLVMASAPKNGGVGNANSASCRWWPDWRSPLIWRLGLIFGSVNAMYFVTNAFLPDYVTAAGRADLISSALTALNVGQLPASFLMLGLAGRLVKRPWAYATTGALSLLSIVGMLLMPGLWIVFWAGMLGFANAMTLILALALPSVLSAPDDVHRTSAGMFTISYSLAMALSVIGGWLWDFTHTPLAGFVPVAACGLVIMLLASTVSREHQFSTAA